MVTDPNEPIPAVQWISVYPTEIHMGDTVVVTGKAANGCNGLSFTVKIGEESVPFQTICINGTFVIMFEAPTKSENYGITMTASQPPFVDSLKSIQVTKVN